MCLMCAHTVFFLHDTEEGPRSPCFKPFVKTTPTRGEKLISSQNDTKFWRTKWGVQVTTAKVQHLTTAKFLEGLF